MFESPSTAAVCDRNAAGTFAFVVGPWNVAPPGSLKLPNEVWKAFATAAEEPERRTSIRLADTERTFSECFFA